MTRNHKNLVRQYKGEILLNPNLLFILWTIKSGLCRSNQEFDLHFGLHEERNILIDRLIKWGCIQRKAGFLRLTTEGGIFLADIEEIATRSEINESASQVFDPGTFQSKETPYLPVKREETHSSSPYGPPVLWNIFARELEKILNQRGLTITRLDDLKVVTHPMKIKRLKASLSAPKSLTTLNTEEMQRLQDILALDQSEMLTLRAALLATAVERTLMDRTEPQLALMAANDVFRLLHQAMLNDPITYLPQATE